MDHIAQIAGKLADHQLDAMLLASQAGGGTPWASTGRAWCW